MRSKTGQRHRIEKNPKGPLGFFCGSIKLLKPRLFPLGLLLITLASFLLYRGLFDTFFTQDEWWEFGRAVDARTQGIAYYFRPWGGHVVPLMLMATNLQLALFGLKMWPYVALAIFGHSLIAITLATLMAKVTRRPLIGILSGLIFAINTAPFHAVTYVVGGVTHIHGATFLFLVSLAFFVKYMTVNKRKFFWLSLLSILLALFFMEYVAFYFFLIPVVYWLFYQGKKTIKFWLDELTIVFSGVAFFVYRFFSSKIHVYGSNFIGTRTVENAALAVERPVLDFMTAIIKNTAKLLPRSLYQTWMTEDWVNSMPRHFKSQEDFLIKMPLIMLAVIALTMIIFVRRQNQYYAKIAFVAALTLIIGAFPSYIFPTFPNMIQSRHLYSSSLGFAVLLALFLSILIDFAGGVIASGKYRRQIQIGLLLVFFALFFNYNFAHINGRLKDTMIISRMRQRVINQALNYYPKVAQKSVFYTTSNLSTPGIPWPVSLGYTFLVMHTYNGAYEGGLEFFRSNKLWPVSEGYEEHGEYGFGLFHDLNPLIKTLRQYGLTEENVYAFHWQATPNSVRNLQVTHARPSIYDGNLLNTTQETRAMIKKVLAEKTDEKAYARLGDVFSAEIDPSFDRPTSGSYSNAEGVLEYAENGIPRITNNGGEGRPGILIEGPSTNFLLHSENFASPSWIMSGATVRPDAEKSPDNKMTADKIVFKDTTSYFEQKIEYPIRDEGQNYFTFSLFLKSESESKVILSLGDGQNKWWKNEIIVTRGWQRFSITAPQPIGGPMTVRVGGFSGALTAWGGQLEESPYMTSYFSSGEGPAYRGGDLFRGYAKKSCPMNQGTISLWFKPEWNSLDEATHILFYNGESAYQNSVKLEATAKALRFVIMDVGSLPKQIEILTSQHLNKWNHVSASWQEGRMNLYLDGLSVGKVSGLGTGKPKKGLTFGDPYRVGVHHGWFSLYADSVLSQLNLSAYPLSAGEIKNLYLSQKKYYPN